MSERIEIDEDSNLSVQRKLDELFKLCFFECVVTLSYLVEELKQSQDKRKKNSVSEITTSYLRNSQR